MTDFETFWATYPRKVAKAEARRAWQQTMAIRPETAELLEIIDANKRGNPTWIKARETGDPTYIPHPASWLRGERWADELKVDLKPRPRAMPAPVAPVAEPELIDRGRAKEALAGLQSLLKRVPA